jgi:hypothetical protein
MNLLIGQWASGIAVAVSSERIETLFRGEVS